MSIFLQYIIKKIKKPFKTMKKPKRTPPTIKKGSKTTDDINTPKHHSAAQARYKESDNAMNATKDELRQAFQEMKAIHAEKYHVIETTEERHFRVDNDAFKDGEIHEVHHAIELSKDASKKHPDGEFVARCERPENQLITHLKDTFKIAHELKDSPYVENNHGYAPATDTTKEYLINEKLQKFWEPLDQESDPIKADAKAMTLLESFVEAIIDMRKHDKVHTDLHTGNIMRRGDTSVIIDVDAIKDNMYYPELAFQTMSGHVLRKLSETMDKKFEGSDETSICQAAAEGIMTSISLIKTSSPEEHADHMRSIIKKAAEKRKPMPVE